MALACKTHHGHLNADFWEKFSRLWQNSLNRSPFNAPNILKFFAEQEAGRVVCFQGFEGGELKGALLLKNDNGKYSFLSDLKTDVNFIIFDSRCTETEKQQFFQELIRTAKQHNWALTLNNQPAWADYMPVFEKVGKSGGLYWLNMPYSVCPVASQKTPQALFNQVNGQHELRYRVNKLIKQKKAVFESLTDDADLDHWVDEFCNAHVLRWENTPTPSAYRKPQRVQFLKGCLKVWAADGILVRFSVIVDGARVGFVIGLLEHGALIHHATTFHPDFRKFSPGKALIHYMAEWMLAHQLSVLDFGDGNEPYKYTVANDEHRLNRIFISRKGNLPFILKTKMIKWTKEHPKIYQYYALRIKPIILLVVDFLENETILLG